MKKKNVIKKQTLSFKSKE